MESASYVTSEQMQLVWGKILANEFENPGSTPPNMTRILSEFTKTYAEAFRKLCSMVALIVVIDDNGNVMNYKWQNMIVYNDNVEFMNQLGISFTLLNELESLGVIRFDMSMGFALPSINHSNILIYVNGNVIQIENKNMNKFPVGDVIFTKSGEALLKITERFIIDGYSDAVLSFLRKQPFTLVDKPKYSVSVHNDIIEISHIGFD